MTRTTPSTSAQGPVAGWKLVPVEPTDDMMYAGKEKSRDLGASDFCSLDAKDIYAAMLTASPSPASSPASPSGDVPLTIDTLAQEIRRVDGNHSLGAGALAEAILPFITRATASLASDATPAPTSGSEDGGER